MASSERHRTPGASASRAGLPYEQPPIFPLVVAGLPILATAFAVVVIWRQDGPIDAVGWLLLLTLGLATAVIASAAVLPRSMKRVRVDADGMYVKGELALPAGRIGQIKALSGGNAATQSWPLSRNRGLKMPARQNLYGGLYGWGPAVGVEEIDRNGERLSTWLIPTRDPQGLTAALEHARDHGRTTAGG